MKKNGGVFSLRIENNRFSKYYFGALGSEEKISRCRHKIHAGTVSTCR
jgi:hypothetical protein